MALGLGFSLRIVVWCMCPLRYPGTGWNKHDSPWSQQLLVLISLAPMVQNMALSSHFHLALLGVIFSTEIIHSLSLTGRQTLFAF